MCPVGPAARLLTKGLAFTLRSGILCHRKVEGRDERSRQGVGRHFCDTEPDRSRHRVSRLWAGGGRRHRRAGPRYCAACNFSGSTIPPPIRCNSSAPGLATAGVSATLIWIEMRARSRRHHSGLADADDSTGRRAVSASRSRRRHLRHGVVAVRPGNAVDAAWAVAGVGSARDFRLGPRRCRAPWPLPARGISLPASPSCCWQAKATPCRPGQWECRLRSANF